MKKAELVKRAAAANAKTAVAAPPKSVKAVSPNDSGSSTKQSNAVAAALAVWSQAQQASLEAAITKFPASNGMSKKARWTAIANEVEGKTLKQCVARVKEIRAQALAQKK